MVRGVTMAGIGGGSLILNDLRDLLAEVLWFCEPCFFFFKINGERASDTDCLDPF